MRLVDLLFPKQCVGCQGEGSWLCASCFSLIEVKETACCADCKRLTNDSRYCRFHQKDHVLHGLLSVGSFAPGVLREAIHVLKYNGVRELARPLALLLSQRLVTMSKLSSAVIVPVPLHAKREAERGFNQANLLAAELGLPVEASVLVRYRATVPQAKLDHEKRKANLADAFGVQQEAIVKIKDKKIVLIDDVSTTGATLDMIADLLKRHGAKQVWGLVLAKG